MWECWNVIPCSNRKNKSKKNEYLDNEGCANVRSPPCLLCHKFPRCILYCQCSFLSQLGQCELTFRWVLDERKNAQEKFFQSSHLQPQLLLFYASYNKG